MTKEELQKFVNEATKGEIGFKALETFMKEKTKPTLHDLCITELYALAEGMRRIIIQQGRDIKALKERMCVVDETLEEIGKQLVEIRKCLKALEERKLDKMIPSDFAYSNKCPRLNGLECPGANASDCLARVNVRYSILPLILSMSGANASDCLARVNENLTCTLPEEERRKIIEEGKKQK